jgi:predicted metal-binding membrane protein
MQMGGVDMTGFRMIPAGMGLMMPASAPWKGFEFVWVIAMWAVMMFGMMMRLGRANDPDLCARRPAGGGAR